MLHSYAEKNTPFSLSPESLDWHLERGWYRMGSTIFTTHFLFFNYQPYSALWIRVPLTDFSFSKSQRKLLRKNAKLFDIAIGPRTIDDEREELYQRYASDFDGRLSPTISDSLEDYDGQSVFNTYEVTVRDRVSQQLVACSYFDLGDSSAASILGIFDPKLRSFSLGYYTMLLEMEYCLTHGFSTYYPGYVVPGYRRFDYKLRLGPAQFFDLRTGDWQSYGNIEPSREAPVEIQQLQLRAFIDRLREKGFVTGLYVYPLFEAGLYDIWNDDYFPYPYLVPLTKIGAKRIYVVAYDPRERHYYLLECKHMVQTQLLFNTDYLRSFDAGDFLTELLAVKRVLYRSASTELTTQAAAILLSKLIGKTAD